MKICQVQAINNPSVDILDIRINSSSGGVDFDLCVSTVQGFRVATAGRTKNLVHFLICACHPCEGAVLIFPVSFQF